MASQAPNLIVSTWRASQAAQQASPARMSRSLLAIGVLMVIGVVVYIAAGTWFLVMFVAGGMTGFVMVTASLHRRDLEQARP